MKPGILLIQVKKKVSQFSGKNKDTAGYADMAKIIRMVCK